MTMNMTKRQGCRGPSKQHIDIMVSLKTRRVRVCWEGNPWPTFVKFRRAYGMIRRKQLHRGTFLEIYVILGRRWTDSDQAR